MLSDVVGECVYWFFSLSFSYSRLVDCLCLSRLLRVLNTTAVSRPLTHRAQCYFDTQPSYLYLLCCMLQCAADVFFSLVVFELKTCIKAPIDRRFINSSFPNESEVTSYHWFFGCSTHSKQCLSFYFFLNLKHLRFVF